MLLHKFSDLPLLFGRNLVYCSQFYAHMSFAITSCRTPIPLLFWVIYHFRLRFSFVMAKNVTPFPFPLFVIRASFTNWKSFHSCIILVENESVFFTYKTLTNKRFINTLFRAKTIFVSNNFFILNNHHVVRNRNFI